MRNKILMTLALLLTAATGAWAADTYTITFSGFGNENCNKTVTDATLEYSETFNVTDVYANYINFGGVGGSNEYVSISKSQDETQITITVKSAFEGTVNVTVYYQNEYWDESQSDISVTCVKSAPAIEVLPGSSANTWTFSMPGSDVVLTPIYAPAAQWATEGNEVLTPKAAEGIVAGTDAPLIVEGSVAAGQGTVMYFATTEQLTAEQAAQANGWLSTLPTAAGYDDATTVYVWYYIKGADTPDGEEATALNTFNDTEICTTPLTVQVLTNKFDITFNAANANTIEAGKATVTVGGTAATVTEGKLQGVKMGSEVKMTAKEGYKFRKVEVKKKAAEALPALNITNPVVGQVIGSDGKNYAYGSLPTGVTAVAKICLVSGSNGLALALADEGAMNWSTAIETCAAHTPAFTGGTWKLASQDEWDNMMIAAGSDNDLRNGFSSVGGTNMQEDRYYWSSTEYGPDDAGVFCNGEWDFVPKNEGDYVRACLAF